MEAADFALEWCPIGSTVYAFLNEGEARLKATLDRSLAY
jgi:hypothetical protein